jgi:hypothetical protein
MIYFSYYLKKRERANSRHVSMGKSITPMFMRADVLASCYLYIKGQSSKSVVEDKSSISYGKLCKVNSVK